MPRRLAPALLAAGLALGSGAALAAPAAAAPTSAARATAAPATAPAVAADARHDHLFPTTLRLPDGFQPEGIDTGPGPFAYVGSIPTGAIWQANLVTGQGRLLYPGGPGQAAIGVETDRRGRLFVAGGPTGAARVLDTRTGAVLATYQLAPPTPPGAAPTTFVNDVVVTRDAAYFTDSINPVVHVVPFGRGGGLPATGAVRQLPITGDVVYGPGFNANGIETTPDGRALLIVQSSTGGLFRVDPRSGASTRVDLGGETLVNGDGLLRDGRTLYAVQNRLNQLAVVRLDRRGTAGTVQRRVTDPRFDVPTTVAPFGPRLYLVNARFGTTPTPTTEYTVVAVRRP